MTGPYRRFRGLGKTVATPGGELVIENSANKAVTTSRLGLIFRARGDRPRELPARWRTIPGRLNRSSVLSDIPAKATRVNRAGPGYKVIRLRRLSHTRQALQSSYPRLKSLDLLKRVVAVLPRWKLASGRQQLRRH